jgi:phage-related protein
MPKTKVVFYKEKGETTAPVLEWLLSIPLKARLKSLTKIERLSEEGHALRRPEADLLRNKIYELRASFQGIHYRILYFFHGNVAAVLCHGIIKEDSVPSVEIDRAIKRRESFEKEPKAHTYEEGENG